MPYDAERVGQLRKMLVEARKRKLSDGLAERKKTFDLGLLRSSAASEAMTPEYLPKPLTPFPLPTTDGGCFAPLVTSARTFLHYRRSATDLPAGRR